MASSSQGSAPRRVGSRGVPREQREAQILDIAGEIFAAEGFHGAAMDEIAARADVSKPMIYTYFGSKQGLYLAYIDAAGRRLADEIRNAVDPDRPLDERLWAGIIAFFTFVDQHRSSWAVLYQEAASQGGPFAAEVAELRSRIVGTVAALMRQAATDHGDPMPAPDAAEPLAHAFVGAGESLANWWLRQSDVSVEQVAQRLMDLAWTGLHSLLAEEQPEPRA